MICVSKSFAKKPIVKSNTDLSRSFVKLVENSTTLTFIVLQVISSLWHHSALYKVSKVSVILFQEI